MFAIGGAAVTLALSYLFIQSKATANDDAGEMTGLEGEETGPTIVKVERDICSQEVLENILEDLSLQYTPFYTHYFHILTAIEQEYGQTKPILAQKLRDKVNERLDEKTTDIQNAVVEKFMVDSVETLAGWITHYSKVSPQINKKVSLF